MSASIPDASPARLLRGTKACIISDERGRRYLDEETDVGCLEIDRTRLRRLLLDGLQRVCRAPAPVACCIRCWLGLGEFVQAVLRCWGMRLI